MRFEQMKKTIFLVVLIAVAGLFSTAQARPVDEARVRLGQVEKTDHGKLNIKFISVVSDSRCAPNVQCIWAGNAKIKISVWKGRTRPQTFQEPPFPYTKSLRISKNEKRIITREKRTLEKK